MGSVVALASLRPHLSASSRSATLMIVKPPICSLPSTYGPSVIGMPSRRGWTTVAVLGGWSPPENTHAPLAREILVKCLEIAGDIREHISRGRVAVWLVDAEQVLPCGLVFVERSSGQAPAWACDR